MKRLFIIIIGTVFVFNAFSQSLSVISKDMSYGYFLQKSSLVGQYKDYSRIMCNNYHQNNQLNSSGIGLKRSSIFLELFGNTFIFSSVNYEILLMKHKKVGLSSSLGFGYMPAHKGWKATTKVPFTLNLIYGTNRHFLEVGSGLTYVDNIPQWRTNGEEVACGETLFLSTHMGYRIKSLKNGLFLKFVMTYFKSIAQYDDITINDQAWIPGVSIGYNW